MKMDLVKEVFNELIERFESTENLEALLVLENYFKDFNFGFSKSESNNIKMKFRNAIKDLETKKYY